jgi:hypothetical protein
LRKTQIKLWKVCAISAENLPTFIESKRIGLNWRQAWRLRYFNVHQRVTGGMQPVHFVFGLNPKCRNPKCQNPKCQNSKCQNVKIQNVKIQNVKNPKCQNPKYQNPNHWNPKCQNIKIKHPKCQLPNSKFHNVDNTN